jgi:hypothetical protein
MPFLTTHEFFTKKLYEIDNEVYQPIEDAFCAVMGEKGRDFLYEHLNMTIAQISTVNVVDVMSRIVGRIKII